MYKRSEVVVHSIYILTYPRLLWPLNVLSIELRTNVDDPLMTNKKSEDAGQPCPFFFLYDCMHCNIQLDNFTEIL